MQDENESKASGESPQTENGTPAGGEAEAPGVASRASTQDSPDQGKEVDSKTAPASDNAPAKIPRVPPLTIVLVVVLALVALALLGVTFLPVFSEYFVSSVYLWIIRCGIVLIAAAMVAYVLFRERWNVRYAQDVLSTMAETNRSLRLLLDAGRDLGSTLDLNQILEELLRSTVMEMGSDMGAVYLLDRDADALGLAMVRGVDEEKVIFRELPMGRGVVGEAAAGREMVISEDMSEIDERDSVFFGAASAGSQVVVPLVARGKFVGTMILANQEPREYQPREVRLLQGLAELGGLAITNAELYRIAKKSLGALSRHREVTGSVLNEMVAGVITVDGNGRIDIFNREAQRLTGYSFGEMAQTMIRPFVSLDANPLGPLQEGMIKALEKPQSASEGEATIMKKDKTLLPVSYRIYPLVDGKDVAGAAAVFMEAGDKKKAPSRDQIDYPVLLRSLGARIERLFMHPLENVMAKVREMNAEEWASSREGLVETLEAGASALESLLKDVEQYLNCITLREWDSPVDCDIEQLVRDAIEEVLREPEFEGFVVSARMPDLPLSMGYERMARSALVEVLKNACQAASNADREVDVEGSVNDGFVRVTVRDKGPGVSAENEDSIFLPFFTTWEGHSGLGLSLARRVMRRLGGRVGMEESEGGSFYLDFPIKSGVPF